MNSIKERAERYYCKYISGNSFKVNCPRRCGIELEMSVIGSNKQLVNRGAEVVVKGCNHPDIINELGSYQLEISHKPLQLNNDTFNILHEQINDRLNIAEHIAKLNGNKISLCGIPFYIKNINFHDPSIATESARYKQLYTFFKRKWPEFRLNSSNGETVFHLPGECALTIINELHVNIEALDFKDAISLFNLSQTLTAPFVALSSNTGICEGIPLLYKEYQIKIFESYNQFLFNTNEEFRVGIFPFQMESLSQYYNIIFSLLPIVKESCVDDKSCFDSYDGTYYGWTRIRVNNDMQSLRIEFRALSTQPSLSENVAIAEFYIKSILALNAINYKPIPVHLSRHNLECCSKNGINSYIYWDFGQGCRLYSVITVLKFLFKSIDKSRFTEIINSRITKRMSPADLFIKKSNESGYEFAVNQYLQCYEMDIPFV